MKPSEQFQQWVKACTENGNACSEDATNSGSFWWGKAAAFWEALVLVKPLEAKLAEEEAESNKLRVDYQAAKNLINILREKLAEAEEAQITEEEVGLLIRRVLVEYLDREEQSHSQFPRSELLGIAWFREIVAAKQPEEHKSHLPIERALALAQQLEKERDDLRAKLAEAEKQSTPDDETVDAIADAVWIAIKDYMGNEGKGLCRWAARAEAKVRRAAREQAAEVKKRRGTQFSVGDQVRHMYNDLLGEGTIECLGMDAEVNWSEGGLRWHHQVLLEAIPAEPKPPTCKCGACTYDAAAQDFTCIMGNGDHVHLRPGQHCTECGRKLEAQ